ncbi:MAG: radical SAM protein [Candidatus Bathyarchaeum tardum]|nr:MAG: radical SAM protein [Candidatus Bathyarchaeum tardum]
MSTKELRLGKNESSIFLLFLKDQPRDLIGILRKTKAILNFLLVEFQHRLLKPAHVVGFPYYLTIETGNLCPLRCSLCPTGQRKQGLPQGFLSFENYKKIIDELADYILILELYNWGEPFLNKDFFRMVRYARRHNIFVTTSSSLNVFDDQICNDLLHSGLNVLMVSLDGASQETVETYQRGNDFIKVFGNLKQIIKEKRALNLRKPLLQWRFFVTKFNEKELLKAEQLAEDVGVDYLELAKLLCDMSQRFFLDAKSQFENVKKWLPKDQRYSAYSIASGKRKNVIVKDCSSLWTRSVINWDGNVFPCCGVYSEKWSFGNVFTDGFFAIWNNDAYRASRETVAFDKTRKQKKTVCQICAKNKAMQ